MTLLEDILNDKRSRLERLRVAILPEAPPSRAVALKRTSGDALRIIAEIKHRSPSAGALSTTLTVADRARAYERGGAAMVSVLCDETFFGGSLQQMSEARSACALPILCKEFILDVAQIDAARAHGADVVLLIVRIVDGCDQLRTLLDHTRALGMEALVEVTSHDEARQALDAGSELVGVNARDLDTLEMNLPRAAKVLTSLPDWVTPVHLSGLSTAKDVARVAASCADAALVGEALMRCDDPEPLLRQLCASTK